MKFLEFDNSLNLFLLADHPETFLLFLAGQLSMENMGFCIPSFHLDGYGIWSVCPNTCSSCLMNLLMLLIVRKAFQGIYLVHL